MRHIESVVVTYKYFGKHATNSEGHFIPQKIQVDLNSGT